MKFTQNTSVITPNTIGNVQTRAPKDPMAYGTAGKDTEAWVGALGQVAKVANKMQDDIDSADHMDRRNKIMTSITKRLYGEDGVLTTGVGENAKGLTDRVQQVVKEEFENGMKGANGRVRRSMAGTFNENMGNYQRIAAQQEGREYTKLKENNYIAALTLDADRITANYEDSTIVDSTVNDALTIISARAADQGWSGQQIELEKRNRMTGLLGGAIDNAIANSDYEGADNILNSYGDLMGQGAVMKYKNVINKESNIRNLREVAQKAFELYPNDPEARNKYIYNVLGVEKVSVGGGGGSGSYSGDQNVDSLIDKYAKEYNVPADLLAAMGDVESNFNMGAVSDVGALGVMQLMPDTAASLGVDPKDLEGNIKGGAKYLRQMLDTFGGNEDLAIAAYNAGPGAVKDAGNQIPNIRETQNHVRKVKEARKKYKGSGVSYEKLDSGIDAEGVDLTGTKPRTIGMINYAHKLYKDLTGKDDFWVSCTTGGHGADTAHGRGDGADVGGSGLKDPEILQKFLAGMRAAGAGANDEYNYKSKGWTGPHVDLKADGDNWQTGENFGGFKGGGSGGTRTKRKYSMKDLDTIARLATSMASDHAHSEAAQKKQRHDAIVSSIMNAGSAEEAAMIVTQQQAMAKDPSDIAVAKSTATAKWGLSFGNGGSSGGTRGSSKQIVGYGVNGDAITEKQLNEAEDRIAIYEARKNNSADYISDKDEKQHKKDLELVHNYKAGQVSSTELRAAAEVLKRSNSGDYAGYINNLMYYLGWDEEKAINTADVVIYNRDKRNEEADDDAE